MKFRIFWGIILILSIVMFCIAFYFLLTQENSNMRLENDMYSANIIDYK